MTAKARWILVLALVVSVFAIGSYLTYTRVYSARLKIEYAPSDATATLDGRVVKPGTIRVKTGEHTVKISRDGFATQSKTVEADGGEPVYVGIALLSNTDSTANWYDEHEADNVLLQKITGSNYTSAAENSAEENPIITQLPYVGAGYEYQIDYGADPDHPDSNKVVLFITIHSPNGKQAALQWMRDQGFNPSDYKIIYNDEANGTQD